MAENQPPPEPDGPPTPPQGFPPQGAPPQGFPSGGLPALPAGSSPEPMPPGMDAEEYRRFQEFQRFQDYQRFVQGQQNQQPGPLVPQQPMGQQPGQQQPGQQQPGQPFPSQGGAMVPPQPGQPAPYGIEHHLSGMQQQLAQLTASQARIERVTNPPTWQKVLRNKWLHRLIWLVIVILLATWGVPKLIHHYFGSDQDNGGGNAALPLPKGQSGVLPEGPHQAVADVYMFVGTNDANDLCTIVLSDAAARRFAAATGAATCAAAVTTLHAQVTSGDAYENPQLTQLPSPQGDQMVISSCDFTVSGGPRLGTFTVTKQDSGWEVTGYAAPAPCPPPPSSGSSTPPTS